MGYNMGKITLVYDIRNSYVDFSKEKRQYSADFVELKLNQIPSQIVLNHKPGGFDLLFENPREIKRDGLTIAYEYYLDDPRCIIFRLVI